MSQTSLTLPIGPTERRGRGRPKGSGNRRSIDLARYIEAQFGGMTPGQQSAALCLVSARELKAAKGDLVLAMVIKARELAGVLGVDPATAWALLAKERMELMPYVHQKRAQAPQEAAGGPSSTVYLIPDGQAQPLLEIIEENDADELQVAFEKSHETP